MDRCLEQKNLLPGLSIEILKFNWIKIHIYLIICSCNFGPLWFFALLFIFLKTEYSLFSFYLSSHFRYYLLEKLIWACLSVGHVIWKIYSKNSVLLFVWFIQWSKRIGSLSLDLKVLSLSFFHSYSQAIACGHRTLNAICVCLPNFYVQPNPPPRTPGLYSQLPTRSFLHSDASLASYPYHIKATLLILTWPLPPTIL